MKLVKKDVRAWLESLNPRKSAGNPASCKTCVLAKYLESKGFVYPRISYVAYSFSSRAKKHWRAMPVWAEAFQHRMASAGFDRGKNITASRALKILDGKS